MQICECKKGFYSLFDVQFVKGFVAEIAENIQFWTEIIVVTAMIVEELF